MQCLLGVHFLRGSTKTAGEQTEQELTKVCELTECVDVVAVDGSHGDNSSRYIVDNVDTFLTCQFFFNTFICRKLRSCNNLRAVHH